MIVGYIEAIQGCAKKNIRIILSTGKIDELKNNQGKSYAPSKWSSPERSTSLMTKCAESAALVFLCKSCGKNPEPCCTSFGGIVISVGYLCTMSGACGGSVWCV